MQWGNFDKGNDTSFYTVTLPTAFSNTNYSVVFSIGNIGWTSGVVPQTSNYTKTTFGALCNYTATTNEHYIAVGY